MFFCILNCFCYAVVVGFGLCLLVMICMLAYADGTERHETLLWVKVMLLFLQKLVMVVSEW